jgi:cyanophycinase
MRGLVAALVLGLHAAVVAAEGHLVLAGGGPTPAEVFERTLALSGGRRAIVAVLPQTLPNDTIADAAVAMWRTLRAAEVIKVSRTDAVTTRAALARATLIWIPGGFPSYFMQALAATPLAEIIRERFSSGVTIGGASAGAVAMSSTMLADDVAPDGTPLAGPATVEGLGLWPEAIVSPHFTERRRLASLMPIVRDHPNLIGIGLDEGTAVIVFKGAFEVLGRGTVSVMHAGSTEVRRLRSGAHFRYRERQ